jgi:GNAT superfamily N-acetyltransferase
VKVDIINLREKNLKHTPEWEKYPFSCKYCLYWELPEESRDQKEKRKGNLLRKKLNWLHKTHKLFGDCGKIVCVNGKPIGYSQYAPAKLFPRTVSYSQGPPSIDAVFISCLFIPQKRFRKLGIGSQLLQSVIDDIRKRGIKAAETFARKGKHDNPSGPIEFYLKHGFRIHRDDSEFPLMRLEL